MTALLNMNDYVGSVACTVNDGLVVFGARGLIPTISHMKYIVCGMKRWNKICGNWV